MEKFPENQNNNSESEKPAEKKGSFKNKLKVWLGLGATAAALTMTGCGKDTNATNNAPTPTVDDGPKTESNIEDAGITTSQDVDTVEFGDGTSVDVSDNGSTSEIAVEEESNGEVDPAKYWEGDTFHLDDYAEALGYTLRGDDDIIMKYDTGDNLAVRIHPGALAFEVRESQEVQASRNYYGKKGEEIGRIIDNSDIIVEFHDFTKTNNPDILNNLIETLQLFSSTDNPYEHIDDLGCWQ